MEKKDVEKLAEEINTSIEELKTSINEKADLSALEEKHTELTDKLDGLVGKEDFTTQQEQLDEISTQLKQIGELQGDRGMTKYRQLLEKVKGDDFKEGVKNLPKTRNLELEIKLSNRDIYGIKASDISTTDINSGAIETMVEPGVSSAPWRGTPIWDNVNKGIIGQGRDSVSWWEEATRTDSAEMVTEEAAPVAGSKKTWEKKSMDIKMSKDYTKVTRSALEDFEYITSEVNDLMQNGIPRLRETELLSGTGAGVYLKGITATGYAKTFAKPDNFDLVSSPNIGDVLAAAILQVQNGNTSDAEKKGYMSNLVLCNPGDRTNMRLLKNAVESYVHHPMLSMDGNSFEGVKLVSSLDLAAGQFVVGDFSRAKAYVKRMMRISFHYENEDDVLNDLVLVLASMRIAGLVVKSHDTYAFVTGTFAAGKELITSA